MCEDIPISHLLWRLIIQKKIRTISHIYFLKVEVLSSPKLPRSKFLNGPFMRYGPLKLAYISLHIYVVKKMWKRAKTQKSRFFMYIFVHEGLQKFSIKYEMVPYWIPKYLILTNWFKSFSGRSYFEPITAHPLISHGTSVQKRFWIGLKSKFYYNYGPLPSFVVFQNALRRNSRFNKLLNRLKDVLYFKI